MSRSAPSAAQRYAGDRVIVRFRPTTVPAARRALHASAGATQSRGLRLVPGLEIVRLAPGIRPADALRQYQRDPNVLYAEPDYRVHHFDQPNDPSFPQLWSLHNTGQWGFTAGADIDALSAWTLTTGSPDVVIGLTDTGIDYTHPDLAPNVFTNAADCDADGMDDDGNGYADDCHGMDFYNYDSDPMDDVGHGTHVAGTIGAAGNNDLGVVGVNWQVKVATCKFLGVDGGLISDAIRCLDYFLALQESGVNLVATNNSWGGGGMSLALRDAIDAHRQAGILFIASAGNDSLDTDLFAVYPADYHLPNIISVAATTGMDELADFSNYGAHTVHLGAPGASIFSTMPVADYGWLSGTSMAAPHVTGVAALLKAQDSTRDWRAIKNLILAGGDLLPALEGTITGKRLNAYGALTCSNASLQRRLLPVGATTSTSPGTPVDFEVLHIECAAPAGELVATVTPGGASLTLKDDGVAPDQQAGDGLYAASWPPAAAGTYTVSLPGGDSVSVVVLAGYKFTPATYSYRTFPGASLNLQTDSNEFAWIDSPFPVRFGGGSFSKVGVSVHGTISFTDTFHDWWWTPLPNDTATTLVAPSWTWLWVSGSRNVYWAVLGTAPNRELVVEWRNVEWYWCFGPTIRFQVVFFENGSDVLFNYNDMIFGTDQYGADCSVLDEGAAATSGIQIGPRVSTQYSYEEHLLHNQMALRWSLGAPEPRLTDLLPFSAAVGDPGFVLHVWGTNFQPASVVRWNGSDRPTTFVDSTHVQAVISADDLAVGGDVQITVATLGGGASQPRTFRVFSSYPIPSIATVNPGPEFWVGSKATLLVGGSDFVSHSVLRRDGVERDTEVLSSTQLKAYLPTIDFAHAGTAELTVFNPAPGGGSSAVYPITIKNPLPQIWEVVPDFVRVGSGPLELKLRVNGLGDSVIRWNGADLPTTVDLIEVNDLVGGTGYAYATVPAASFAQPARVELTVYNTPPGGGTSVPAAFDVLAPPVNDDISQAISVSNLPFSDTRDTRAATVHPDDPGSSCSSLGSEEASTVWFRYLPAENARVQFDTSNGDYFQVISVWSGQPGAWTEVGCGSHSWFHYSPALVDVVAGNSYWIVVVENGNFFNFTHSPPPLTFTALAAAAQPGLSSITPALVHGGWDAELQFTGSNFTPASVAIVDGWQYLATTFVSSTRLSAVLASPPSGDHTVQVNTPPPGGGVSQAMSFSATGFQMSAAPASLTISPGGTARFTLTVTPGASGYDKPVEFACFILPPGFTCSFSPPSVTPGASVMQSTLSIAAPKSASAAPAQPRTTYLAWLAAPTLLAGLCLPTGRRRRIGIAMGALFLLAFFLMSCGGGGSSYSGGGGGNNRLPVRYSVALKATSGGLYQSAVLDVYVQP